MRLVVIGHGMVGARFVEEVIAHDAAGNRMQRRSRWHPSIK